MDRPVHRIWFPVLAVMLALSGCAALVYEIVWFQLLQLTIGSSAISLGVLLATYMGGMCVGSLLLARWIPPDAHPVRVYAGIELGIGLCGLAVLFGLPVLDRIYLAIASPGASDFVFRALISAVCLLIPTILMGASLPAIARWFETSEEGVSSLGILYGSNIAGAVLGALLAGFYLLRLYDMATATYAAAGMNAAIAAAAWMAASIAKHRHSEPEAIPAAPEQRERSWPVYLATALSGLCALGAEVVWTRQISLMLGATVYTFSIILAVFLTGLGLGSWFGSRLARTHSARVWLGICQLLLAGTAAWAAYAIAVVIPGPGFDPTAPVNPFDIFKMDLIRSVWAVFPAAVLWGASFPLALGAIAAPGQDPAALVGETYAANTIGGIIGSLGFSLILIPRFGTLAAERWLIALAGAAAVIVLVPMVRLAMIGLTRKAALAGLTAAVVVIAVLAVRVRPVPWLAIAYGRRMNTNTEGAGVPLYIGEGMNSSIVVSQLDNGTRYFHVSGKVEATTEPYDMRLERMLGHLSALLDAKPESVLVVGFGAGITAGSFVLHPSVQRIVICEIEKLIPPATSYYFNRENYDVLHDSRTRVFYDDARHFVLTSRDKFDVITSDPIHPWVKGTSTLYSKEYFEMCKRHLKPGGVVTQWVPLYESDFETVKSEIATFFEVFPHGTIWNSDATNQGYDTVLVGQAEPGPIDIDRLNARLHRPDHARVLASLAEVGIPSTNELLSTFAGRQDEIQTWLKGVEINTDLNMRLQYLAGWGLNFNHADAIYQSMLLHRGFPADLFRGSPASVETLRLSLEAQRVNR